MHKKIALALCACLFTTLLCAPVSLAEDTAGGEKLRIVSTIFPPYDFVRQIAGDNVDVSMLLSPGSESHSFEPSPQDIIKIQNSDIFLYVGGDTDAWVDRILASMDTENMTILPLLGMVDAVDEEIVEGMEHGHDHEHDAVDAADVQDRPLSDWARSWQSLAPMLDGDGLDAYLTTLAEENSATLEETRAQQAIRWQSDISTFSIEGDTLTIGDESAPYTYEGYAVLESDHGASVWYQYKNAEEGSNLPGFLIFNDHNTNSDMHGDPHTHLRYGDIGFPALLENDSWSPFFVEASATPVDAVAVLSGHGHSHDEEEEDDHDHTHEEEVELDEHVWTSPKNAMTIVSTLTETLIAMDSANADTYRANADAYLAQLKTLDEAFIDATQDAARTTVVFGDRFPFRYLADAYGLSYYAAFPGCATETEASASTIAFLIDKVRAENIPAVFHIEFSNEKIADVLVESTDAVKLQMHSCHNLSKQDFEAGVTYLDLMTQNAQTLKEALH